VSYARPAQDVSSCRTVPLRGNALGQRSGRLLSAVLWIEVRVQRLAAEAIARTIRRGDRGDVPGWVLVTVMTSGLVLALWGVARGRLTEVFNNAIDGVLGSTR
jgi:hypothetical protein